jgi:hypothetical protein
MYRLTGATFQVTGPESVTLSSDADPSAATIDTDLVAGTYSVVLAPGWHLSLVDPYTSELTEVERVWFPRQLKTKYHLIGGRRITDVDHDGSRSRGVPKLRVSNS